MHKKTTNWRILVVVVKWRHRAIVLYGTRQSKRKTIGDSVIIKAIEEQKLSESQSVKKICSRSAKIAAIKDQLIPVLQHTGYDSVIIHAGTIEK